MLNFNEKKYDNLSKAVAFEISFESFIYSYGDLSCAYFEKELCSHCHNNTQHVDFLAPKVNCKKDFGILDILKFGVSANIRSLLIENFDITEEDFRPVRTKSGEIVFYQITPQHTKGDKGTVLLSPFLLTFHGLCDIVKRVKIMPRQARRRSESGIYHIMIRGINQQQIFEDEEDSIRFLETLSKYKEQCGYIIYAYCLMGNHVHILLKEGKENLTLVLKRIAGSYVYWYNWKYRRSGHLFQDRFKSEPVENDEYFLTVIRYIHQNPVKAGICKNIDGYKFSSYNEYINNSTLIDANFCLDIIDKKQFIEFNNEFNDDTCLDIRDNDFRLTDDEALKIIWKICRCKSVSDFQKFDKAKRNYYIEKLHKQGLSIRQISRLTGLSRKVVENNI